MDDAPSRASLTDLVDDLERALTAAEQAARPDPETVAAVRRITAPAKAS